MAIQDGDIKLLKSKVMDDVPEGGGGPTGQVVEWGKSNQIFDDVTEVARAGGQVSIRQLHAAVQTGSTDPLLDANIIIDQMPTDPNVSVTLAACEMFATRTQIAKAIADYQIAGTVWSGILLGNHVANQGNIQIFHRVGTAAPNIGATLVIVQDEGQPTERAQFVRIRRTETVERTFSYMQGAEVKDYQALVSTCDISPRLSHAFKGSEPNRLFTADAGAAKLRDTTVADAMRFYGASTLTAAYELGDPSRQVKVASIYTQLVPSSRSETISLDQRPAALRSITLATGPREVTVAVAPHTQRFTVTQENRGYSWTTILRPFPSPGTVVVSFRALGKWYTCQDNGSGELQGDAVGTVNYNNGNVALSLPAFPDVGSMVLFQWGETTGFTNRSGSAAQVRQPEYALQLQHQCLQPGSVAVSWESGGVLKTISDAGGGTALVGSGGTGLVNHASGQILIRPTAWIDAGGEFLISYRWAPKVTQSVSASPDAGGWATIALDSVPAPGSLELRWMTVRNVSASSGAQSSGGNANKSERSYATSYGNGYISQSHGGYSTASQRLSKTQDQVQHQLVDDGQGGLSGRGSVNYAGKTVTVKLVDLDATTSSYSSDHESSRAFESQSGPSFSGVSVGGGGLYSRGGQYSTASVSEEVLAASTLQVTYCKGFATASSETLSWAPPALYIDLLPHSADYVVPGSVLFSWMGHTYMDVDGDIIRDRTSSSPGVVAGRMDYEGGMAFLHNYGTSSPSAPFQLQSLWTTRQPWTTACVFFRTPAAPVAVNGLTLQITDAHGNAFTLTPDAEGYFISDKSRGRLDYEAGVAQIQFGELVPVASLTEAEKAEYWFDADEVGAIEAGKIWRPISVDPTTLRFNLVSYTFLPLDADIIGMDPVRLPADGRVPVFSTENYVVIGHTGSLPAATISNGQTLNCGRTRLSRVWMVDATGAKVQSGWTADLDAGTVTVTDASSWAQPVQVFHRIEEMARVADVQINGTLTLTKALSHDFPVGSVVSSALYAGTLRARVSHVFDQANWDGVTWADSVQGNQAPANFNDTTFPITVSNAGAITERWVLRFKSTTEVEVIGEHVGNLGTFPIAADIAPLNPNTKTDALPGVPYLTVPAAGWGSGWAAGNVLRINTVGAMQSFACIRTVQPSEAAGTDYSFGLLTRGDVDRAPGA